MIGCAFYPFNAYGRKDDPFFPEAEGGTLYPEEGFSGGPTKLYLATSQWLVARRY